MGNPILDELSGLSPEAQQALMVAHSATTLAPPAQPAAPAQGLQAPSKIPPTPQIGAPPAAPTQSMTGPPPSMGSPSAPHVEAPRGTLEGDQNERARLESTGSGVSQIHSKIEGALPNHPTLGKVLGYGAEVPARILDAVGGTLAPGVSSMIPGTTPHHAMEMRNLNTDIGHESEEGLKTAQTGEANARTGNLEQQPELAQAKMELATEKQGETAHNHQQQIAQHLATAGYKEDETGKIIPLPYEEMSEQQQATHDYRGAQEELAKATTDLRTAQKNNIPSQIQLAQQRIQGAQQARSIAMERLGLSEKQFEMRAHGTEGGTALPGALLTDQGPVGTAFQHNVSPTDTEKNAAGRATTMNDLSQRIREGLKDPEILSHLGPIAGREAQVQAQVGNLPPKVAEFYNDLKSYGAFQAGLHPVRGIGGLQYFDKIMGGLAQTPEQLEGKLTSNERTAGSVQKVGSPKVAGGNTPNTGGGSTPTEGQEKVNSSGIPVVFRGGKWQAK